MRIVICDSNPKDLEELEKLFLKHGSFCSRTRFETEIKSDLSLLSDKAQQEETADVYLLDTALSKITGIDLGSDISPKNSKIFEALDYALSYLEGRREAVYLVKTKAGMESIPYSQIEYIENASRRLEVHLADCKKITSIYIRKSFEEEIKELLGAGNFICTHKSFLINMDYVRRLGQNMVVMESGIGIPVSRKYSMDVKKKYHIYSMPS